MGKKRRDIPLFKKPIIETHCHLDYLKEQSLSETIEKSQSVGVEKIITISVSPDNLDKVDQLTKESPLIYGTQGIHPHQAKEWSSQVALKIKTNTQGNERILAIGEIGLDFYYNNSERDDQLNAFNTQLEIATELDKPVVIHSRDADTESIEILNNHAPKMNRKGVIHSFTSGPELAQTALDLGFHLGFNGIITFNSAQNVRDIVEICPIERILLETDAPFLTPVPYRGRENAPFYLPFVAEKIAEIKGLSIEEVLEITYQNSLKLFFSNT